MRIEVDTVLHRYNEHYINKKWIEVKRSIPRALMSRDEEMEMKGPRACVFAGFVGAHARGPFFATLLRACGCFGDTSLCFEAALDEMRSPA